jgi:hypothetical protein
VRRNQSSTPVCGDLVGTDITFTIDLEFVEGSDVSDNINIAVTLTEADGTVTTIPTYTVPAVGYTGNYFGFITRGGSVDGIDFIMDYKSFSFANNSAPALEGYDQWATQ